jgi:hypothetical protein
MTNAAGGLLDLPGPATCPSSTYIGMSVTPFQPNTAEFLNYGGVYNLGTLSFGGTPSTALVDNFCGASFTQAGTVVNDGGTFDPPPTDCFVNAASDTVASGSSFSFAVTVSGFPAPTLITSRGRLPRGVKFHKGFGTGKAVISGTARATRGMSGSDRYLLTITAVFGKGKTKHSVTQAFTLTVNQ